MDLTKIENILQRYWTCETSIEEEKLLKEFFSGNDVPECLLEYKPLFVWEKQQQAYKSCDDFDQKILANIHLQSKKKQPVIKYFYPILKVAAVALALITIGVGVYTTQTEKRAAPQVIYLETYSDPQDAMNKVNMVFDKVSTSLMMGQEVLEGINIEFEDSMLIDTIDK